MLKRRLLIEDFMFLLVLLIVVFLLLTFLELLCLLQLALGFAPAKRFVLTSRRRNRAIGDCPNALSNFPKLRLFLGN